MRRNVSDILEDKHSGKSKLVSQKFSAQYRSILKERCIMLCNRNVSSVASDTGVPGFKLPL